MHIDGLRVKYHVCFSEFHQNNNNFVIFISILILNFYRLLGFEVVHACSRNDGRTDGIRDLTSTPRDCERSKMQIPYITTKIQKTRGSHAAKQETPKVS